MTPFFVTGFFAAGSLSAYGDQPWQMPHHVGMHRPFVSPRGIAQDDPSVLAPLVKLMDDEESVRVKNKIADGVAARDWSVPDELREPMRKTLPYAFSIDAEGHLKKRETF